MLQPFCESNSEPPRIDLEPEHFLVGPSYKGLNDSGGFRVVFNLCPQKT